MGSCITGSDEIHQKHCSTTKNGCDHRSQGMVCRGEQVAGFSQTLHLGDTSMQKVSLRLVQTMDTVAWMHEAHDRALDFSQKTPSERIRKLPVFATRQAHGT